MTHFFIRLVYHICLYFFEYHSSYSNRRSKLFNHMGNLSKIGRIFYGIAITGIGLQTIYYCNFPYILPLPQRFWNPGLVMLAVIFGIMFIVAGVSIVLEKKARQISLL